MCMIIVQDMICISWSMKKAHCKVTLFYSSPAFSRVQCGCDTLTWVSSLSTQYPWVSGSPPEVSSRFIRIRVHWPSLQYGQHLPETCYVLYLQNEIIQREQTRGSLSTISPNINEWRAITGWDFTSCRLGSTRAIMDWPQSVHVNGHRWASQLMI